MLHSIVRDVLEIGATCEEKTMRRILQNNATLATELAKLDPEKKLQETDWSHTSNYAVVYSIAKAVIYLSQVV